MAFGKEIKRLREEVPISAQKLADLIGIDVERMRKWEQKDMDPRHEDAMKIEGFFGMDLKAVMALKSIKKFLSVPHGIFGNRDKKSEKVVFEVGEREIIKELLRDNRQTKATVNVLKIAVAQLLSTSEGEAIEKALVRLDRTIDEEADRLFEIDKKKYG